MKNLTLRIFLKTGPVFDLICREPLANEIFKKWTQRDYHVRNQAVIEGRTADEVNFSILVDQIVSLLLLPGVPTQPSPGTQMRPGPWSPGISGHN